MASLGEGLETRFRAGRLVSKSISYHFPHSFVSFEGILTAKAQSRQSESTRSHVVGLTSHGRKGDLGRTACGWRCSSPAPDQNLVFLGALPESVSSSRWAGRASSEPIPSDGKDHKPVSHGPVLSLSDARAFCLHITNELTEAQRGEDTCWRPHSCEQ